MPVEVIMPKVDMDMTEGTLATWHVKEGDAVTAGALLFEIETGKAAMEIEAPCDGVIRGIAAAEGAVVPVGQAVAFIYRDGESVSERRISPPPILLATAASGLFPATPLARRLARERGVPFDKITGSGPRGRIVAADVQATLAVVSQTGGVDANPVDGMHRAIAERLTLSKQMVPHFFLSLRCDLTRLSEIRDRLNAQALRDGNNDRAWKLSVNDFVIKAMALALKEEPAANVTWAGTEILWHRTSDVAVAVTVEGGLFTPVIRSAEAKSLSRISLEMKDLAARARARKLLPAEYQGGTTTISNLGMFGIEQFTAIINPPHATILAVGSLTQEFVPVDGLPVLRTRMACTLSCDHRAVEGATGARLLAAFRDLIEDPALMLA